MRNDISGELEKAQAAKGKIVTCLSGNGTDIKELRQFQCFYIEFVLASFGGNKVHAAKALGIDRRTIQRLIRSGRVHGNLRRPPHAATADTLPAPAETRPYPLEPTG